MGRSLLCHLVATTRSSELHRSFSTSSVISLYNLLDVPRNASAEELREAYLTKVKQWHPDRFPATDPKRLLAEIKLKELNRAYETLKDAEARVAYDRAGTTAYDPRAEMYPDE